MPSSIAELPNCGMAELRTAAGIFFQFGNSAILAGGMWERVVYRTCDWVIGWDCEIAELRNCGIGNRIGLQMATIPAMADEPKSRVVSAETIGLIVIAVMLAIMILARWAGIIAWSAR